MNCIAAIVLFAGAVVIPPGSAAAQSNVVEVKVPFNFTVNNTVLPAGNYRFGFDLLHPNMLVIRDRAENVKATDFGQSGSIGLGRNDALIFHRHGRRYFLSEVHFDSASNGFYLPATKSEQQAARRMNRKVDLAYVAAEASRR